MPQRIETISRFSPGNCKPELLESMLVGRGELVDRLEKSVVDSVETGAGHHWLLIGPRGAGKTHVLAVLYDRVHRSEEIRSRVVIAYMKEEERGVASFLDWLVRILRALNRWQEKPAAGEDIDLGKKLEDLTKLSLESARTAAERLLLRFVGDRRLILIAENLGEIFDEVKGMGREGQQRFRDLIQQHPFWTIMASSQALFEDVQAREAPFYGFFRVQHLGMFDLEESVALLKKLADLEGRTELRTFFDTELGRGRIRAIHQLTGGNPRLLVVFYQFVDRESIEDLATPFLEMVDSLTSYYQEQMHPLPALQQKIVEFLCERRVPVNVKEIAQSCFISQQSASKQLGLLAKRRYVVSTAVGRRSFYELREPLLRICFEVKENLGYPIRLFVDFLGTFYSVEELKRKYRSASLLRSIYESGGLTPQAKTVEMELGYLWEALSEYHSQGFEVLSPEAMSLGPPERETIEKTIEELFSARDYRELIKLADATYDLKLGGSKFLLRSAAGHRKLGDLEGARDRLDRLVRLDPSNLEAWIDKATLEMEAGEFESAENSFRQVQVLDEKSAEALIGLGVIRGYRGKHDEALGLLSRATSIAPSAAGAWWLLGIMQERTGEIDSAQKSFEKATELAPNLALPWLLRGKFLEGQEVHETALECFEKAAELAPDAAEGWRLLGVAQERTGEIAAARESFEKAIELAPDSANCWWFRGLFLLRQEEFGAAHECFERVTVLTPEYAEGWRLFGIGQLRNGEIDGARKSFEKATELAPDSARAWLSRGVFLGALEEIDGALDCLDGFAKLSPDDGHGEDWSNSLRFCLTFINEHLLRKVGSDRISDLMARQFQIFEEPPLRDWFVQSLTGALMGLLEQHDEVSTERLVLVRDRVIPELADIEELSVACRLFAVGVEYVETENIEVLLSLPREERQSLEEILKTAS